MVDKSHPVHTSDLSISWRSRSPREFVWVPTNKFIPSIEKAAQRLVPWFRSGVEPYSSHFWLVPSSPCMLGAGADETAKHQNPEIQKKSKIQKITTWLHHMPITGTLFVHPVLLPDEWTYEKRSTHA